MILVFLDGLTLLNGIPVILKRMVLKNNNNKNDSKITTATYLFFNSKNHT